MEQVKIAPTWWNLRKIEADTGTGITYKWYHENSDASDSDETGILERIVETVDGTTTTYVHAKRKGSWTARATGWGDE